MSAGCSYCGAPVKAQDQGGHGASANAWSRTKYECGTVSHSDGVERSTECALREAEGKVPGVAAEAAVVVADVAPAPAGLLGDMTALALSANVRSMTIEGVHQSVTEICKRYGLQPKNTDREAIVLHATAWINARPRAPHLESAELAQVYSSMESDILNRLNITIHEMRENA